MECMHTTICSDCGTAITPGANCYQCIWESKLGTRLEIAEADAKRYKSDWEWQKQVAQLLRQEQYKNSLAHKKTRGWAHVWKEFAKNCKAAAHWNLITAIKDERRAITAEKQVQELKSKIDYLKEEIINLKDQIDNLYDVR